MIKKFNDFIKEKYNLFDKQEKFINKSINFYGDKYDYSKVVYINPITPVEIICPKHGVFKKTPHLFLQGKGCPECELELKNYNIKKNNYIQKLPKSKVKNIHADIKNFPFD